MTGAAPPRRLAGASLDIHPAHEGAETTSPLPLVTGASSGIGKAFAERLAGDGYDLIVVGRRRERLDELAVSLADVEVRVVAADLSTDDGIDTVAELCATQPLTMLVNNAAVFDADLAAFEGQSPRLAARYRAG